MNVREAVKDKANYSSIVTYFKNLQTLGMTDLVLLIDVIDEMSEEIFEHYKALQELCKRELQRIRQLYENMGTFDYLEETEKCQLAYIVKKACSMNVVLAEKYESMAAALTRYL